ncbi:hypothetical protein HDU98_011274 [Podochytrium sp. JEL0797]|nr:hypothetical protein HDU98_011274 [Podochytrium sp. JEL0797]
MEPRAVAEPATPTPTGADSCAAIHTCFRLRKGWCKVVREGEQLEYFQAMPCVSLAVALGSRQHQAALAERIAEIDGQAGFEDEVKKRRCELNYLRQNCPLEVERDDDGDSLTRSETQGSSGSFTMNSGESSTLNTPSELNAGEIISVSHATFGEIGLMREFSIKRKEKLFRKPKVRQFFHGPVLHRSSEEMHSGWSEIFSDLLYCGIFARASLPLTEAQSWHALCEFIFVMVPLISHWNSLTLYNNAISHEDLSQKILIFLVMTSLMVMGNTVINTFNPIPENNTATIFLGSFVCARLFITSCQFVSIFVFNRRFWTSWVTMMIFNTLNLAPYLALLSVPVNGTSERENTRWALWWFSVVFEVVGPYLAHPTRLAFVKYINNPHRVAINIEHLAERNGALYTISLGVIALTFLYDTKSQEIQAEMGLMVLALIVGNNLNHIYFRAEMGNHYKHALRRKWYTGVGWGLVHIPLVIGTLGLGAIMSGMIQARFNETDGVVGGVVLKGDWKNIFFVCFGLVYFCFFVLRGLHQDEPDGKPVAQKEEVPLNPAATLAMLEGGQGAFVAAAVGDGDGSGDGGDEMKKRKRKSRRSHQRRKMPNLTTNQILVIIAANVALILGLGLGVPQQNWNVDSVLGFAAAITTLSVFTMEWAILKKSKAEAK